MGKSAIDYLSVFPGNPCKAMIGQTTIAVSMSDRFASHALSLTGPASAGFAVLPNDNLDLAEITRALYVGIGGDLVSPWHPGRPLPLPRCPAVGYRRCEFLGSMPPARQQRAFSGRLRSSVMPHIVTVPIGNTAESGNKLLD